MSEKVVHLYESMMVLAVIGLLAAFFSSSEQKKHLWIPLAFVLVVSVIVSVLFHYPLFIAVFSLSIAALSVVMPFAYASGRRFYPVALLVIAGFVYIFFANMGLIFAYAQMFGLGTAAGFFYLEMKDRTMQKRSSRSVEINRDIFQIALGICFLVIALVFKETFKSAFIIVYLVLAAYIYNRMLIDHGKKTRIYKGLLALERERTVYGLGAMYASAGLLLLAGFLNSYNFLALGIFVLFHRGSARHHSSARRESWKTLLQQEKEHFWYPCPLHLDSNLRLFHDWLACHTGGYRVRIL